MNDELWGLDDEVPSNAPPCKEKGRSDSLESIRPAPIWRRAVAWLFDTFLLFLLFNTIIFALLDAARENENLGHVVHGSMPALTTLFPLIAGLLYFILVTASPLQATPGKLAVRIRVASVDGGRPSAFAVLAREVLKYPCLFLHFVTHGADLNRNFTGERRMYNRYSYEVFSKTVVVLGRPRTR